MPKRIEYAACFGRTIEEKQEEDGQPSTDPSQQIVVRDASLRFVSYDDRYQIVVESQTQSLFVVPDYSDTLTSWQFAHLGHNNRDIYMKCGFMRRLARYSIFHSFCKTTKDAFEHFIME
ncbi:unnamed protein product, partial [Mesorhabditis spiculigera]